MIVSHNIPALMTHLNMKKSDRGLKASMQRLSSGFRINSAKEDATGLAIANKLAYQVAGLNRASENATHGIALIQTAEGALNEVHNMLQRMRELAVQAAHGTYMEEDRAMIQREIDQLTEEIQAVSSRTEYNKMKILNGEGARVTESRTGPTFNASGDRLTGFTGTEPDKAISTLLYISEQVPQGVMTYEIDAVGQPAMYEGSVPNPAAAAIPPGAISVNGIQVRIDDGDSYNAVQSKLNEAYHFAGITKWTETGAATDRVYLVTDLAGSNQQIDIQGNPALLAIFGLTQSAYNPGTDAQINELKLFDESGNLIPNSNLSVSANGNQVTVRGITGEEIKFNIQVVLGLNPSGGPVHSSSPWLTFGDKVPVGGTGIYTWPAGVPLNRGMALEFKDYGPIKLQVGPSYNNAVSVQIPKLSAETMGFVEYKGGQMYPMLNYHTTEGATQALTKVDNAIHLVSQVRSRLGAFQNRLESTIRSLDQAEENTETSRSRIQDTDMAREMTAYSQHSVMHQAAMAILSQANQRPQQVLQLLQ